jgi:hypothetical protein
MGSPSFEEFVLSIQPREGPFRPFAYRSRGGRQLEFYVSNESCYGRYVDPGLTLMIGQESGRVVGAIIPWDEAS